MLSSFRDDDDEGGPGGGARGVLGPGETGHG
jgi:hypothetical protein